LSRKDDDPAALATAAAFPLDSAWIRKERVSVAPQATAIYNTAARKTYRRLSSSISTIVFLISAAPYRKLG
jgi:hypothetical protein